MAIGLRIVRTWPVPSSTVRGQCHPAGRCSKLLSLATNQGQSSDQLTASQLQVHLPTCKCKREIMCKLVPSSIERNGDAISTNSFCAWLGDPEGKVLHARRVHKESGRPLRLAQVKQPQVFVVLRSSTNSLELDRGPTRGRQVRIDGRRLSSERLGRGAGGFWLQYTGRKARARAISVCIQPAFLSSCRIFFFF
jgi:hypothetical protein